MNKSILTWVGAAVGLGCALILILLWQRDVPAVRRPVPTRAKPVPLAKGSDAATSAVSDVAFTDDEVLAVYAAIERMLARPDVRPHETVLTFKDEAALARFLERAGKAGLTVLGRLDALRAVRVHFDQTRALLDELAQNTADYANASGNFLFNIPQIPAKDNRDPVDQIPFRNDTLDFIGATGDRTQWGRGVTIAILDTGVGSDATFGSGRLNALDIGLGLTPGKGNEDGHGTAVASLAGGLAADAAGVAPAANLLSIRVTDANGTSDIFTLAQAIVAAVDAGARVVNISLGGYATNQLLNSAIGYAETHGAVIVAAAGNDQAAQLAWPAADPRVISVGAVDKAGQQVAFSNSGPQLELTAPGYGVQAAWLDGQRAYVDGTSASAPLVSGAIAAVMSKNPGMTAAEAAQLLTRTASDSGSPGADPNYGNGILNLGWALNANNPSYVDTAIASHYYDATNNQMDFVVQNRSGRAVAGLSLAVSGGALNLTYPISYLAGGQSTVIKVSVDAAGLNSTGRIQYATTLTNPSGTADQVPANNRRTSVLTSSKK